ncbi:MAG: dipeptidase PepV [Anaerovoracaceae bacterium]
MKYSELIKTKVTEQKPEIIKMVQELISKKSIAGEPTVDMPFGEGVDNAYKYMLSKAIADGFETKNVNNYGGHIEFGEGQKIMGILCHLDVVPEGDGWTVDPFVGEVKDHKIFGRGAIDNKGPTVASYFAMKILKEMGITPNCRIRLILGLDEETNWEGIKEYAKAEKAPDFGFTPDGDFPLVNREKGILLFDIAKKFAKGLGTGISLRNIAGGNAPNMVPDFARAVINSDNKKVYEMAKERANEFRQNGKKVNTRGIGKSLEIVAKGVSAHGAKPESGVNAISILMEYLGGFEFNNEDVNDFLEFYNKHIGYEVNGESIGVALCDQPSGNLIFNVGMIQGDDKSISIKVNVRYPVTLDEQNVYTGIEPVTTKYNLGIIKIKHQLPVYISEEDELVTTLMEVYKEHTGQKDAEPISIGGGTYARAFKNIVAFGPTFPLEPQVEHKPDEYIDIDNLIKMTEIFAEAIYKLTL